MGKFFFGIIAAFVILLDQLTKVYISSHLTLGQIMFEAGFFRIILVHNTGAAFGLFPEGTLFLIIVRSIGAIIILIAVFAYGKTILKWAGQLGMVTLGLIMGGTVGNLIDCLRLGYVIDFVDLTYWPVFNVADSTIVVAMFLSVYLLFRISRTEIKHTG
jgi:signal peptidase II